MNMNRRTFVGMSVAVAAATKLVAEAPKATIDPFKAPHARFWVAALSPLNSHGDFDHAAYNEMLAYWKSVGADGVPGVHGEHPSGEVQVAQQRLELGDVGSAARRGASLGWSFSARPPSELTVRVSPQ